MFRARARAESVRTSKHLIPHVLIEDEPADAGFTKDERFHNVGKLTNHSSSIIFCHVYVLQYKCL